MVAEGEARQAGLVEGMLDPGSYTHAPGSVELRETHTSWVFLAGDLAYKVKKPVVFPFLDYGTLERRCEMCLEEVRLNRRLAPEIYLRVVGIVRRGDRLALTFENDPAAIEYAVEMRRVEEDRSLAALASRGELEPPQLEAVAGRLARFHGEAPIAPAERADVRILVATLEENLTTLRESGREILDPERVDAAESFTRGFLAARRNELEARARTGLVRDCHGDLRAEHVIVPEDAPLYVYDCIEFNPALRQIDVAADIAFLIMDLARLGAEEAAFELTDAYRRAGGDPGDDTILSFFASYRAWVRAKVACLRALELSQGDGERRRLAAESRALVALGHRFAWRARQPLLLVLCGVAGSGKTTVASLLARFSGWRHISSDEIRKRLAGLAPTERGSTELYSAAMTTRTYRELGRLARRELDLGKGVIVDATFHRRVERDAFREALGDPGPAALLLVECTAPEDVLLDRVRRRELELDRISDADHGIVRRQLDEREPLEEWKAPQLELVTEAPPGRLSAAVEAFADRSLWQRRGAAISGGTG